MRGKIGSSNLSGVITPARLSGSINSGNLTGIIAPSYISGAFAVYTGKDKYRTIQTDIDAINLLVHESVFNLYEPPVVDAETLSIDSIIPTPSVGTVIT